jgi:hypothetical protein
VRAFFVVAKTGNLFCVDLWVTGDETIPPLHLVDLLQLDREGPLVLQRPGALLQLHLLREVSVYDKWLSLHPDLRTRL